MIVLLLLSIICVNARPLGVVSSVWSALLGTKNYSVPVLVELLAQTGVSYIELRQGSLPGYEDAQLFPNASALFELVTQFPKLRFSYAFSLPFLSFPDEQDTWNSTLFVSALAAAVDMARNENGVRFVRVVDVKTNNKNFNASLNADIKDILGKMSFFAAKSKLNVGVENAALQWATFWELLFCASPANQPTPSLVFDPCNIAWVSDGVHDGPLIALDAARHLWPNNTALLHAKQVATGGGAILPVVCDGATDWFAFAAVFNQQLPSTPLLLEIASTPDLLSNIAKSSVYLQRCGFTFD